ncbi:MAG TPA: outer membrane beta-barrel protein [Candidatus Sulfotelmatobacter sp.]|nr:outer membrane beta-barrel protein [Candidatus Sulfotelmatobacter sp.]
MKLLYIVLFLGLSVMGYAQSQTSDQASPQTQPQQTEPQPQQPAHTNAPPPKPQQSAQTLHQTNAPPPAPQQSQMQSIWHRFEVSGGYAHISGDGGMDGFNVGASFFLAPKISLGFNYDSVWDTSTLGSFALTNVGLTVANNHMQDYMAGGRIYFPGVLKPNCGLTGKLPILHPFVQAQFGESNLYSKVTSVNIGTISSSDTRFTWLLGGGADIRFSEHWYARGSADLVRTHFADVGQSRIRVILGIAARF